MDQGGIYLQLLSYTTEIALPYLSCSTDLAEEDILSLSQYRGTSTNRKKRKITTDSSHDILDS